MQKEFNMLKFTLSLMLIITTVFIAIPCSAQVEDPLQDADSITSEIDAYNSSKDQLELLIKKRECAHDLEEFKQLFVRELAIIDSIIGAGGLSELPNLVTNNKLVIVGKKREGRKCISIMYKKTKYISYCEESFHSDSIDWGQFKYIAAAKEEGTVCLRGIESSAFTVEPIPNAELTQKSADLLLKNIKRVLTYYGDVIPVTYDQYVAKEKKQNFSSLKDMIGFRTQFLNKCRSTIK